MKFKTISLLTNIEKTWGANIAALRIYKLLKKDFKIEIISPKNNFLNKIRYYFARILVRIFIKKTNYLNSLNLFSKANLGEIKNEILHIHWIGNELISIEDLIKINKPIIWTMHDMWPVLTTEHYIETNKFKSYSKDFFNKNFLKKLIFKKKKRLFDKKIYLVATSLWLKKFAKKSCLTKDLKIVHIYNPIKTNDWNRLNCNICKKKLNLNIKKKYILFGAHGGLKSYRKGSDLFLDSLKSLSYLKNDFEIVILGTDKNYEKYINKFKFHFRKTVYTLNEQLMYHSIADFTVIPSREDNCPLFAIETLLCENPVVAFDTGGINEIVKDKNYGYLAKPFSSFDFAKGIEYTIKNLNHKKIFKNRKEIIKRFDEKNILKQYKKLFKKINLKNT